MMRNNNWTKWLLLLALLIPLVLVACGGADTPPADEPTNVEVEEPVDEPAEEPEQEPTEEPMEEPTEEPMEEPTEEPAEEPMEEPTEEAAEEPMETAGAPTANGLTACEVATDGPFAGVDPTGVSFTWWHQHSGEREERLAVMLEEFNSTNACGITITGENQGGYDEIRDKVNASITAGELPAALIVGYQNDQAFYQLNDALVDLDPYISDPTWGLNEEDVADFYPTFLDQSVHPSFDNQRLGFPPNRSMEVLFYNQTWLEELGFDGPPTTPDEFREQACAARDAGSGGYILRDDASAVASWAYAFGGDVLDEAGTGYNYADPALVEAMAFVKDLYDDGCAFFFTEGFPNPEFAARRALFTQGSSSGLPFYASDIATVAEEEGREPDVWGVTAIPHTTPDPVQNIYGADVMITRTTPEQQLAAWIFVKWFTTPEGQADWVRASDYFPTRVGTNALIEGYVEENPQWGAAAEMLQFSYYEPQLISYQSVRDAAAEAFNTIMNLPEDVGVDNTGPIEEILVELTDFANAQQEELMAEIQ
jgi:multiple sugar transport system substrate-binding protein/sn-glycerol 3-phosphate transport system substrate-binding protein